MTAQDLPEEIWILHASYCQWLRTVPPFIEEAIFWWEIELLAAEEGI